MEQVDERILVVAVVVVGLPQLAGSSLIILLYTLVRWKLLLLLQVVVLSGTPRRFLGHNWKKEDDVLSVAELFSLFLT